MIGYRRFVASEIVDAAVVVALAAFSISLMFAQPQPSLVAAVYVGLAARQLTLYIVGFRSRMARYALLRACRAARSGDDAGAEAILGRVDMRRLPPKDRKPFLPTLGALALRRGRPLEARAHLYEALSLGVASLPEAAEVRLLLARAELALGDTAAAAEHLRVARGLPRPPRLAAELRAAEAALGG